jgi:hypothetical protein
MFKINPKFVYNENGEKVRVIISRRNFERILEKLEDFCDYQMVIKRGGKREKTYTHEEVRKKLGLSK